jgi:hypothetical protein
MAAVSDEDLLAQTRAAREAAHNVPLAGIGERHTGERHILHPTSTWAIRSREWMRLMDECERRGLKP